MPAKGNPFQYQTKVAARGAPGAAGILSVEAAAYLKQIYALVGSSMLLAVASGYTGMHSAWAMEHPILMMVLFIGSALLAMFVRNTATLFLFAGVSGFSIGPVIAHYVSHGMAGAVGQALFSTGAAFGGLTLYSLTTRRDLSRMGGILFAGLIVLIVGGLVNMFVQSSAMVFALSAGGAVIFSGLILWETQQYKENPWALPPAAAALSLYLNVFNLFLNLLQLFGLFGGKDE
ncbi:MAG: Bax inhibitor-1/YccA family protein [Magnetococcales bacterium]|nr:Bax inhibitor-1/YccA family protein [Magnetococcales bacterium]